MMFATPTKSELLGRDSAQHAKLKAAIKRLLKEQSKENNMAAKTSQEMKNAERYVTQKGMTPPEAAQRSGITVNSIYRAAWYRNWKQSQGEKK